MKKIMSVFAVVALLLAAAGNSFAQSADVNAKDTDGQTALMKAASAGNADSVTALIAAGADVNAKDRDGQTALMKAASAGNTDSAKALIAAGSDVNAKDRSGQTALVKATISGHADVVHLLQGDSAAGTPTAILTNVGAARALSHWLPGGPPILTLDAIDGKEPKDFGQKGKFCAGRPKRCVFGDKFKVAITAGQHSLHVWCYQNGYNNSYLSSKPEDVSFVAEPGRSYGAACEVAKGGWVLLVVDLTDKAHPQIVYPPRVGQ